MVAQSSERKPVYVTGPDFSSDHLGINFSMKLCDRFTCNLGVRHRLAA
jgi:hypothetical protein